MTFQTVSALWRRLLQAIGRGRITLVDDSGGTQRLQVRLGADELSDDRPRLAEYGFTSVPPDGTDVVMLFIGGERSGGVVIATNNQTVRMRGLGTGEVAVHDDKGRYVLLSAAGITVHGADDPVTVETTAGISANAGGDVTISAGGDASVTAAGSLTLRARSISIQATETLALSAAAINLTGPTALNGDLDISGALRQGGHDLGVDHFHADGTRGDGNTGTVLT
ncbi:MAG: phage baseplate assembly protein V [Dokdonella sp.]|uniref:phage baseplate assembly protein V n=1 Tax=Dokdonella sp. TaxID=2291710 RepID=UPI003F818A75